MTEQPLLTVKQVAEYLQISPKHAYRLVAEKRIPFIRVGAAVRFRQDEIDTWVASRSHKAVS